VTTRDEQALLFSVVVFAFLLLVGLFSRDEKS
jgi:hypothetical protein